MAGIDRAMASLNAAWQAASQEMYQNTSQAGPSRVPSRAPTRDLHRKVLVTTKSPMWISKK